MFSRLIISEKVVWSTERRDDFSFLRRVVERSETGQSVWCFALTAATALSTSAKIQNYVFNESTLSSLCFLIK